MASKKSSKKRKRQQERARKDLEALQELERARAKTTTTTTTASASPAKTELPTTNSPPVVSSTNPGSCHNHNKLFLTSHDQEFESTLAKSYHGFSVLSQPPLEEYLRNALERLRDAGYYQYDVVMAGGKTLSKTFVKRTLVGEPGITYKYLGLRLFAHSWEKDAKFRPIQQLNQKMINYTQQQLKQHKIPSPEALYKYNLTLINYMEPTNKLDLKEEESVKEKVSVSWHSDSSLELGSSIAVYQCLPTQKSRAWDWKIALRPAPGVESQQSSPTTTTTTTTVPPPSIVVPTKAGDVYFMLGDFNDRFQHMVVAGSSTCRISSTHRVATTKTDTYSYILQRVRNAKKTLKKQLKHWKKDQTPLDITSILDAQAALTEVELEWIAQYWVQGARHDVLHVWWQGPMRELERYWLLLEDLTFQLYIACLDTTAPVPIEMVRGLLAAFKTRNTLRRRWDKRRADNVYQRQIVREYQPVEHPVFLKSPTMLPKDLSTAIQNLSQLDTKNSQPSKKKNGPPSKFGGKRNNRESSGPSDKKTWKKQR